MDTDRKRTSKSKRYELGYHLAIDWCKVPYVLMILVSIYLISTVAASAYQNNTDTRENDIIPSGNSKKIVQKLISVKKDIETDPNLDLSVIALNRNLSSGNVGRLSDFFKLNSSLIKSDEKIMSNFSSDEIGKFSENKTETIKIDLLHNVEIDTTAIPTTENFESSTEFNTEIYTTIVDEEFRSTTEYFSTEDDITTFKSQNENEFSIDNISSLDTSDRNISNTKRQLETKNFNDTNILSSTTLKNIVHQIQEQVKSLNDSLHSDENVIEDSYKSTNLTSSDKKSNKTETSSGKFERKMDVLSEVNGTVGSESERNGTALVSVSEIEKIQNITDSKNSSKSSTDDDYNSSYEMEDYDEDKIFTMKKSVVRKKKHIFKQFIFIISHLSYTFTISIYPFIILFDFF